MAKTNRSFTLPMLSLPPIERIGLVGYYQPKKSCKTSCAAISAAILSQLGFELDIFQNDVHDRLKAFGTPTVIELASARDMLKGKNTQDLRNNESLFVAIDGLRDHPKKVIMHDSSAPAADRIGSIYYAGSFNDRLVENGCTGLLFVPFRPITDVAEGAISMMNDLKIAMPDHFVVPIAICDLEALHEISPDHAFWRVVDAAEYGVVPVTSIAENYAHMLERIRLPITAISDRKDRTVIDSINNTLDCGYMTAGGVAMNAAALLRDFYRGLFEPLGFTAGA